MKFRTALNDDLNTPRAIAVLFDLARSINRAHDNKKPFKEAQNLLCELANVLGFTLADPKTIKQELGPFQVLLKEYDENKGRKENLEDILWALLEIRKDLRQEKKWAAADRIRDRLSDLGIELQDSSSGTTWKIQ